MEKTFGFACYAQICLMVNDIRSKSVLARPVTGKEALEPILIGPF